MELYDLGMNFSHDGNFKVARPHGSGDNLLLLFKTRGRVILNGVEQIADVDSALLYERGEPQHYYSDGDLYTNHWVHMNCQDDKEFFKKSKLIFNMIFSISNMVEIEKLLMEINMINLSSSPIKAEYIDLLIKMLLLKLEENYLNSFSGIKPKKKHNYSDVLENLRGNIYSNVSNYRSITEIAHEINISPSHFQYLYKKEFGISCYDDIITSRMKSARYYLENTDMTVKLIANMCGYENDVHFMRQFKDKMGITPSEYRQGKK